MSLFKIQSDGDLGLQSVSEGPKKLPKGTVGLSNFEIDVCDEECFVTQVKDNKHSFIQFKFSAIPRIANTNYYMEVKLDHSDSDSDGEESDEDENDSNVISSIKSEKFEKPEVEEFSIGFATRLCMRGSKPICVGETSNSFGIKFAKKFEKFTIISKGKVILNHEFDSELLNIEGGVKVIGIGWNSISNEVFFVKNKTRISLVGSKLFNISHPYFIFEKFCPDMFPTITLKCRPRIIPNNETLKTMDGFNFSVVRNPLMLRSNPCTFIYHEETPIPIMSVGAEKTRLFVYKGLKCSKLKTPRAVEDETHMKKFTTLKYPYAVFESPTLQYYPMSSFVVKNNFAYIEVKVVKYTYDIHDPSYLSIGVAPFKFDYGMCGNAQSYGYYAYNGDVCNMEKKTCTFEKYHTGDVVGVGFNVKSYQLFFTKNGKVAKKTFHLEKEIVGDLCLTITASHKKGICFMPVLKEKDMKFRDFKKVEAIKSSKWLLSSLFGI